MSDGFWPWWVSGPALAAVALGYWFVLERPMGVSGSLGRALRFRAERVAEKADAAIASEAELAAALSEATRDAFGDEAVAEQPDASDCAATTTTVDVRRRLPVSGEVLFLAMILVGGFVGAVVRGGFAVRLDMGEAFAHSIGRGALGAAALVVGGLLVGFGTRLAGGCTSGHGLAGCARLERGSLVTTACFFGAAVVVSLALGALS
jgi:uncharacterized protein